MSVYPRNGTEWGYQEQVANMKQKLAAKDLDDWEQKRVKRLPGEHDGVL